MNDLSALTIARRMAELGQREEACRAYTLALSGHLEPEGELEAALYLLQAGGDYQVAYTTFVDLYRRGFYQEDLLSILTQAFYEPNVKLLKSRYEKNCKALKQYPYLFRRDFLPFEDLPIRFYPFNDKGYLPFYRREGRFGPYIDFNHPVVSRNFFRELDQPILATEVFSLYELSYLHDNVRKSEWVGRDNHIYLHYSDWDIFCAYLQVLNLRPLLEEEKFVFLIGEEISQYPIDFQTRFGIDYSQYPVKPLGITEVHRLIWHTQLATHNGGDFFNEIFDGHPNLIATPSIMMENVLTCVSTIREALWEGKTVTNFHPGDGDQEKVERILEQLYRLPSPTDKDIFVALFLCMADLRPLDPAARIAPAVFFQPHFPNMLFEISTTDKGWAALSSAQYDTIRESPVFRAFPYIKTFTPMRRPTTSTAASVKFMRNGIEEAKLEGESKVMGDAVVHRLLNRSFMIDPQDRLYQDSVLVRFEDGKLNPKATFTALAAFLDLPYTESLTYCSLYGQRDPESLQGNDLGFSPAAIYRTYDEYMGEPERYYLEYFMRDAYEYYGYDFQYYDGAPVDLEKVKELVAHMDVSNRQFEETFQTHMESVGLVSLNGERLEGVVAEEGMRQALEAYLEAISEKRITIAETLLRGLRFVNKNGQPLRMMPRLELDPALLEQPLYH